jgi:methylmalonyl-CoA mutase
MRADIGPDRWLNARTSRKSLPMSQPESLFSGFPPVTHDGWKSRVLEELKGADYTKIVWKTPEGFTMEPWYNRRTALSSPTVPFARTSNRWRICVQVPVPSPETAAENARKAVEGGADAIEYRFSTQAQADPETMAVLLGAIDPSKVAIYLSGATGDLRSLAANLFNAARSPVSGAILAEAPDAAEALAAIRPEGFRTLAVDTGRFHEAGATITQEIAFALAGASDLLSTCSDAAIPLDKAAAGMTVVFSTGTSHFPELAKLRAFRAMWARLLSAWGIPAPECPVPEIFVRASRRSASLLDPYTNILRLSTEAVSAILGGCDTLQLSSFDPGGSVPPDLAGRITTNIHHLLREESGLDRVIDPAAGSYYIDTLTATLCREAWKLFQEIEAAGGLRQAEANGKVATMTASAAEAQKKAINTRKRSLIGINRYAVSPSPEVTALLKANPGAASKAPEFEQLRVRVLTHIAKTGSAPLAELWLHGDPVKSLRVAAFAEDFLRCGGFEVAPTATMPLETRSCRTVLQDEPDIVVLCWTGENDLQALPAILGTMQELRKETVVVMAAKPPENAADLIKAGLDQFIHMGSDAYATLLSLQHKTGVL